MSTNNNTAYNEDDDHFASSSFSASYGGSTSGIASMMSSGAGGVGSATGDVGGSGSNMNVGSGQRKRISFTTLTNSLAGGSSTNISLSAGTGAASGSSSNLGLSGSVGAGGSMSSRLGGRGFAASENSSRALGHGGMLSRSRNGNPKKTSSASDVFNAVDSDLDDSDGQSGSSGQYFHQRLNVFRWGKNWKSSRSWKRRKQQEQETHNAIRHDANDPSSMAAAAAAVAADDSAYTGMDNSSRSHSSHPKRPWTKYGVSSSFSGMEHSSHQFGRYSQSDHGFDDFSGSFSLRKQNDKRGHSRFSSAFGSIKPRTSAAVFARTLLYRRDTANTAASAGGTMGAYGQGYNSRSTLTSAGAKSGISTAASVSVFGGGWNTPGGTSFMNSFGAGNDTAYAAGAVQAATYRRYKVGEPVLVEVAREASTYANLVNRYGYPAGRGNTPEEMRGPYKYSLATVIKVHFEENTVYYTVKRADTGLDQRADAEWMEPVSRRGAAAARRAASTDPNLRNPLEMSILEKQNQEGDEAELGGGRGFCFLCIYCLCLPFFCVRYLWHAAQLAAYTFAAFAKHHGYLFLYGKKPYSCRIRITMVNAMVFCSIWYNFMDQARIAFLPPKWDLGCAYLSCIAWSILVLELVFEVFVRPDGYKSQILSEKAFESVTVRYINRFHLIVESLSLITFVPEFVCLFTSAKECQSRESFSFYNATLMAVIGPTRQNVFYGRAYLALIRLRVFGLVRHWKKMWINNTVLRKRWTVSGIFVPGKKKKENKAQVHNSVIEKTSTTSTSTKKGNNETNDKEEALTNAANIGTALMITTSHRAMAIFFFIYGLYPLLFCFKTNGGANPVASEMVKQLQQNNLALTDEEEDTCEFFRTTIQNWAVGITAGSAPRLHSKTSCYLLRLQVEPVRCSVDFMDLESSGGVVTVAMCDRLSNPEEQADDDTSELEELCENWKTYDTYHSDVHKLGNQADVRQGAITIEEQFGLANMTFKNGTSSEVEFRVVGHFNNTFSMEPAALTSLLLQICWILFLLAFLSILRRDAGILVLDPLRRMLKFVAQYAKNPLTIIKFKEGKSSDGNDDRTTVVRTVSGNANNDGNSDGDGDETTLKENELGSFETEQLITAVSKITDLLRKCWGVAGVDIISTNLARQEGSLSEVFNPTVPGKSVYALFGFCAVDGFDRYLRNLEGDIMILINDVASVLHNEVFRWGFGDSGQCNKNLGSAWLMVFRIGNVKEVIKKLEEATHVVFASSSSGKRTVGSRHRNRNASASIIRRRGSHDSTGSSISSSSTHTQSTGSRSMTTDTKGSGSKRRLIRTKSVKAMNLSLKSLPGISNFTDRALIGMLKTFAGIYRDNKLLSWKNDFRLGCGVGVASPLNMIFGMDAGWAVEGAVGSEYKIDATYLSPHVNMASRMMSACKQYGVSILLSEAVHELLSDVCQKKLRHLDTVTVKGSSVRQRIYTYDARHKGVDFFLFQRSDEQADVDSDQYTPSIWNTDQDLTAMRQHITDDFLDEFEKGRDNYLAGDWPSAMKHLEAANQIMTENVVEQGYIEDELAELHSRILDGEDAQLAEQELRNETEDGPSCRLLTYMKSEGGVKPASWQGYRPLTSK